VLEQVIIIQHPYGGVKQIDLSTSKYIVYVDAERLQYVSSAMVADSGAPILNWDWRVVALHHAGGNLREPGTKKVHYRNEGIHINVILDGLIAAGLYQPR
jgi:hypothetical protein